METILHLFITNTCRHNCPLCCNKLYVIDEIPVVTVELLKKADTVCLTGGEPFGIKSDQLRPFIVNLRTQYPNINNLYIYTSGAEFYNNNMLRFIREWGYVDGINFAPKDTSDWVAVETYLRHPGTLNKLKSNRLYVFEEQRERFNIYNFNLSNVNIEVLGRKWQQVFNTPDNEHFVRLPILF